MGEGGGESTGQKERRCNDTERKRNWAWVEAGWRPWDLPRRAATEECKNFGSGVSMTEYGTNCGVVLVVFDAHWVDVSCRSI